MVWTKRIFGPGPERLTNVFLNRLAEQISSSGDVLGLWRPGVLFGLEPDFSNADTITVSAGACVSAGHYFEFREEDASARRLNVRDLAPGEPVWLYVAADGKLNASIGLPPGWPDHQDQPTTVEQSYCVLGWAVFNPSSWAEPRDVRHFIRSVPNDAILVVGDVNAGADFEHLQQALDYLEACFIAGRAVSRHLVVTQDQHFDQPIQVRLPGVRIEARSTGPQSENDAKQIALSWDYGLPIFDYLSAMDFIEDTVLFNLNGHADVSIEGFDIVRTGEIAVGMVWNPGDRLRLARCRIDATADSLQESLLLLVVGIADGKTLDQVCIEDNRIQGLIQALTAFFGIFDDFELLTHSTSCFRYSVIQRNRISVVPVMQFWPGAVDSWRKRDQWSPVIDCGENNTYSLFNRVSENEITGGQISIRVGRQSRVHSNVIRDAALYGVLVVNAGPPSVGGRNVIYGGTEVSGNIITMWDPTPEPPLESPILESPIPDYELPWWRSAIHLELISCQVAKNRIDLNNQVSNGITSGLLGAFSLEDSVSLLSPSDPPLVGLNEYAHGRVVLTEAEENVGGGFLVDPNEEFRHQTPAGDYIYYRTDRRYYLPPGEMVTEPRSLQIFVQATTVGPDGYVNAGDELDVPPGADELYEAKVDDTGITGIFSDFLSPPPGVHVIKDNDIENFVAPSPIEWTVGEPNETLTQPSRTPDSLGLLFGSNLYEEGPQTTVGRLQERDIDTGEVLQQVTLDAAVATKPLINGDTVFVCTRDRKIQRRYLSNLSLDEEFTVYTAPGDIEESPTYFELRTDDLLAFATTNGWVVFLNAENGSELSTYYVGSPVYTRPCSYTKHDEIATRYCVVVGSDDHAVYSVSYNIGGTANLEWSFETGDKVRSSPTSDSPSAGGVATNVYFGSDDGKVYCYNVVDNVLDWSFQLTDKIRSPISIYISVTYPEGPISEEAVIETYILAGTEDERVNCVTNKPTGISLLWDYDVGVAARTEIAVRSSTGIAFTTAANSVDGLDIKEGVLSSRVSTLQTSPSAVTDLDDKGLGINDATGRFSLAREETPYVATAPPVTGFGIALPSAYNRVTGNQITGSSCGIFVLDRNNVGENVVFSSTIGILVNARNTVWANQVWYYQAWHYNPDSPPELLPQNPLLPDLPLFCGIWASRENVLEANLVWGLPFEAEVEVEPGNGSDDEAFFGAIFLVGLPILMIGLDIERQFNTGSDGGRPLWVFANYGGNTVSGNQIDLGIEVDPGLTIVGAEQHCGIVSLSGLLGSIPPSFKDPDGVYPPNEGEEEYIIATGFNTLTANTIVRCGYGALLFSADVMDSCHIAEIVNDGIVINSRLGPRIQACHVADVGGHALNLRQDNLAFLTVRDSVLMRPADPQIYTPDKLAKPTVFIAGSAENRPEVHLSDCLIVNHEDYGIKWGGNYGSCNSCYFFTMNPNDPVWDPADLLLDPNRKAAIVFDHEGDQIQTQGNLVVGAHMAHCKARIQGAVSTSWDDTQGPIQGAGTNYFPPRRYGILNASQWSNRIHWPSNGDPVGGQFQDRPGSCYYVWTSLP
jgi:PQQ-like domain